MLVETLAAIAIVTQDQAPLRAAPRDSSPVQAVLWQGDGLEIRGEKGDYLQVYDHRRERAGYIRITQARRQGVGEKDAPELLSVTRFLRDMPGSETLGIAYAAAYLSAAPAKAIDGEIFDAIGVMAERLARRASSTQTRKGSEIVAGQLDVAAAYGVTMQSFERDEQVQLCYDGEAFRRVLALAATSAQKAQAALSLTRHDCVPPDLTPGDRFAIDNQRADILDRIDSRDLPETVKNRLHMRKAGVWASIAYQRARRPELGAAAVQQAGQRAIDALAAVNKSELTDTDATAYSEAAVRAGASRWAAEPVASLTEAATPPAGPNGLSVATAPGQPGETCLYLLDAKHGLKNPLLSRCTYGVVWTASATASRDGSALTLAVQPLDSWRELWVFQQTGNGWIVDIAPPGPDAPGVGYIEFAGWTPGNKELLAAREVRKDGRYKTSYEVLRRDGLVTDKQADKPNNLSPFYRGQDPQWKAKTVSLR